jgi:hypothetical protein
MDAENSGCDHTATLPNLKEGLTRICPTSYLRPAQTILPKIEEYSLIVELCPKNRVIGRAGQPSWLEINVDAAAEGR